MKTKLFIEIEGNTFSLITGRIKFLRRNPDDPTDGFGYIEVEGWPDVRYLSNALCFVVPGATHPKMSDRIDIEEYDVSPRTAVVLLEPESGRNGGLFTRKVFSEHSYNQALATIANRPYYRAIHTNARYNGQFASAKTSVYAEGTLEEILAKFPRLAPNDPLGPTYVTGPIVVSTHWERRTKDGWSKCQDPRSFPSNVVHIQVRVFERLTETDRFTGKPGKCVQSFYGHLGNLMERPKDFLGEQFFFEIRIGTIDWTEVADPRRKKDETEKPVSAGNQPLRKVAVKPSTPAKSVAMPKSTKSRPAVLKSLSDLSL